LVTALDQRLPPPRRAVPVLLRLRPRALDLRAPPARRFDAVAFLAMRLTRIAIVTPRRFNASKRRFLHRAS
jgi:hypothetical protein